jgi:hypothetical protein
MRLLKQIRLTLFQYKFAHFLIHFTEDFYYIQKGHTTSTLPPLSYEEVV